MGFFPNPLKTRNIIIACCIHLKGTGYRRLRHVVFRGILDAEPAEIKKKPPSMTRVDGAVKRVNDEDLNIWSALCRKTCEKNRYYDINQTPWKLSPSISTYPAWEYPPIIVRNWPGLLTRPYKIPADGGRLSVYKRQGYHSCDGWWRGTSPQCNPFSDRGTSSILYTGYHEDPCENER